MARSNSVVSVETEGRIVLFTVADVGSFEINIASLSNEVIDAATIHGIVQKISDAAALSKEVREGMTEQQIAQMKHDNMLAVRDRLQSGEWNAARGDGSAPVAGVIFRAFVEYCRDAVGKKCPTEDKLRAWYDGKTRAEQLALRSIPAIATIIERMKSERGAVAKIDTADLLGELSGL